MKIKFVFSLSLLVLVLISLSCSTDDNGSGCPDNADCIPIDFLFPGQLNLTFLSLETGGDIFVNNIFNIGDLQINDALTSETIDFSLIGFADLNENGIVDDGDFVGSRDQITVVLSYDPEENDFMYEIVLSESKSIRLDFSALRVDNDDVEITDITFDDTMFEALSNQSYNVLVD